jgi:hypothetical protein
MEYEVDNNVFKIIIFCTKVLCLQYSLDVSEFVELIFEIIDYIDPSFSNEYP